MHRPRIIAAFAILAMLGVPGGSFRANAQGAITPESLSAANELMAVMSKDTIRQMVSGLTNDIWPSIERAIRARRADIDQPTMAELRSELERIELQYMTTVMADAPQVYARHFTEQELRDMLAFYRTPTGQKSVQLMPQVMTELFAMTMPKMQSMQTQIMETFMRVLRQRGITL